MERLAENRRVGRIGGIERVAQERVAGGGHVNTDLMGPAGFQLQLQQ